MRLSLLLWLAPALLLAGCGSEGEKPTGAERPLTLVLDFAPNGAHAGIYTTVAKRHDRGHGLRMRIRQPTATSDSLKLLASGRAELAVADIHDLGLARERGEDLVGVGAVVQRPLAAVIAGPGARRPRDLEGRRVGVTGVPSDEAVLRSVVESDGGDPRRVRRITIGFTAVPSLLTRKVAGATAFWNVEGVALRRRGFRSREFRVDEHGAPRYPELVLVARRETLDRDRDLVVDALAALAEGTTDALGDRGAAARVVAQAAQARPALIDAQLDAIAPALGPPIVLDRPALDAWARFDVRFGILRRRPDVGRAFDTSLAPRPREAATELSLVVGGRQATLTCDGAAEATGFLRDDPQAHCRTAQSLAPLLTTEPPPGRVCTQIYGGPQKAHVTGRVEGQPVDRRFDRSNGCAIDDWNRAAELLGGVPRGPGP